MHNYPNDREYFNRDLSWIEFNRRVFSEAIRPSRPLLERLKFLSIVSSNFDEFFMVRVASLKSEYAQGDYVTCLSKLSPSQQLAIIYDEYRKITTQENQYLREELFPALAKENFKYFDLSNVDRNVLGILHKLFMNEYFPLLTPVRLIKDAPRLPVANMRLHLGFLLKKPDDVLKKPGDGQEVVSIVQLPASVKREIALPSPEGEFHFTLLEDLIIRFATSLFPGYEILEYLMFRVIRDADFPVDENRQDDFVEAMEEVLTERLGSEVIQLCCSNTSTTIRKIVQKVLNVDDTAVFEFPPPLDIGSFINLVGVPGFEQLCDEPWKPVEVLPESEELSIWDWIKSRDHVLIHPFDSFSPVLRMIDEAAQDPNVMAIKMTLYRTSKNSPIIAALERAAKNGKQVSAVVELKARFDEQRNIQWAESLERAGVIVIYGIAELKIHAKALLIIRKEEQGIRRYLHIATGNYNEKTAKLYTDVGLITARENLCYEAGLFFNAITGYADIPTLKDLAMAPVSIKTKILSLIQREIDKHSVENPSKIVVKINSLSDKCIIDALYKASQAGVTIDLNIRGICMLKPGVKGLSENIRVISVLGRYLEHARVMSFHNAGNTEVFISSADWMERNLDRRVELLLPVMEEGLVKKLSTMLDIYMNAPGYELQPDGKYRFVCPEESSGNGQPPEFAQYEMYQNAVKRKHSNNSRHLSGMLKVRRRYPD